MNDELLQSIMALIMHGGNAKGLAIQAIKYARNDDFIEAEKSMNACDKELNIAHKAQTEFLVAEAQGSATELSLLMIHGQDHIMNAITTRDLAFEMIECLKKIREGN
ncbi:PTS lactose/cellobiose transporter subunit IIA [Erysipelothrix sp. HDW6C]|uniref:PTS lactose/cellobiose transporter subunit IIA n=1 Tax=Erysipelothrix sp. HDW6C TaxID=2714930 RepID=UPI001407DC7F|nr:PTS lactose/cellobiose transporter subunit IIA [Erysipelothrix sp. HDW6C]QIK70299.1 PTS lactose/cellobiose transporter subunit IIA [Erysipelothrix sp. HDW6C]